MRIEKRNHKNQIVLDSVFIMSEDEQRELISWFYKNKPEMVRDIICEECPEHTSDDKTPYHINERERGH